MFSKLFWVTLRSVAIPIVAYLLLRETFLGEAASILSIAIALTIVTFISVIWNILKIFGNAVLLKGKNILIILITTIIQLASLAFIWIYFLANHA